MKDSGGTLLATYKWDGLGHRVREIRGSTTTDLYYSDQWQVLEERVGGVAKFSYAWSPVYVDAMIARDRDTDANGTLDERLYTVQDANFNATALINTSGTVVERYQYDPFGKFSVLDAGWAARGSSSYGWNYLHQGGRWDADGGVFSFRNRELSPTLGRWLQMDPKKFAAGDQNLFRFVLNSPTSKVDPSGLWGFGLAGNLLADIGVFFIGAGVNYGGGIGLFSGGAGPWNIGIFGGGGGFAGGPNWGKKIPGGPLGPPQFAVGGNVAAGLGIFFTNADNASDLAGLSHQLNMTLGPVGVSYSGDGAGTYIWSVTVGPAFESIHFSVYDTWTVARRLIIF